MELSTSMPIPIARPDKEIMFSVTPEKYIIAKANNTLRGILIAVMMVGLKADRILQGLDILESQLRGTERTLRLVEDYSMPNVSEKVARIILSYTDYVNRVVWKKY